MSVFDNDGGLQNLRVVDPLHKLVIDPQVLKYIEY
jgi:hypothetical protein